MLRHILFCLLLFPFAVSAQKLLDTGSFQHFDLENGFPSNNVYSVIQDKKGYLWFATDNGVVRYNGYSLDIYNTEKGALPNNDVYELYEDSKGRIWLCTFGYRLGYIENGKYCNMPYPAGDKLLSPVHFAEAGDVFYFIERRSNKTSKIIIFAGGITQTISFPDNMVFPGDSSGIFALTTTDNLTICIWTFNRNIFKYDIRSGKFKKIASYPMAVTNNFAYRNSLSPSNEIYLYQSSTKTFDYFDINNAIYSRTNITDFGAEPAELIYSMVTAHYKGNYAKTHSILTQSHIYSFTKDRKFIGKEKFTDIIPSKSQIAFHMKDRVGNTWYTTNGDGAFFKSLVYDFYSQRPKISWLNKAAYIGSIKDRTYWWPKPGSSLYELKGDSLTGSIVFDHAIEPKSITGNDSVIYITASDGIYVVDQNRKPVNVLERYHVKSLFHHTNIDAGFQDPNYILINLRNAFMANNILYAFSSEGVKTYSRVADSLIIDSYKEDRYTLGFWEPIESLLYYYNNSVILIRDYKSGAETVFNEQFLRKNNITNIKHIEADRFGNIFILNDKHLSKFNAKSKTARSINTSFSVSGASFCIYNDELFIAGKFGIAYAAIKDKDSIGAFHILPNVGTKRYNKVENFTINESGYITLQTDVNWTSFKIDSFKKYAAVFDKTGNLFSLALLRPFEQRIAAKDSIRVDQKENLLKLDAINWYGKGAAKFTYRVDGTNTWEESTSGELFLASLSPGIYHQIECRISDDAWQSNTYTFYVYRKPYWYQTSTWKIVFWITGIFLFLSLVLIAVLITRSYVARKSEKKRALTELELRAIHSQINPHFIFNTLNSSLYFINKKRFDDAYEHVNKFSRLLRAYLKSSQDRFVILEEEISMLKNYIELQQTRFENKFEYHIEVDNKLPVTNIRIPSLLLQPLVENAINHGLFHKGDHGKLKIKFLQGKNSSELICIIDDNGVGRMAAKKINEETAAKESYGTKLTNQLLEIFKEYEHLDISLEYTDKLPPETGTIVTLTLKNIQYVA